MITKYTNIKTWSEFLEWDPVADWEGPTSFLKIWVIVIIYYLYTCYIY